MRRSPSPDGVGGHPPNQRSDHRRRALPYAAANMRRIRELSVEPRHTISHSLNHRSDGRPVTRRDRRSARLRWPAPERSVSAVRQPVTTTHHHRGTRWRHDPDPKSVRIAEDEAKWLSRGNQRRGHSERSHSPRGAPPAQRSRGGQPHQARDRRRDRKSLQVQTHPAPRRSPRGALTGQGAFARLREHETRRPRRPPAPHTRSRQLKLRSNPRHRQRTRVCARSRNASGGVCRRPRTAPGPH